MSKFWPRDGIHFSKNEDVQIDGRHVFGPKSVENVILHILNTNKKVTKIRRHFLKKRLLFSAFGKPNWKSCCLIYFVCARMC